MTSLKGFNKYFRTSNATATAKDIRDGKTAYAGDEEVTGTMGEESGVIVEFEFPKGTGSFTPVQADYRMFHDDVVWSAPATGWTLQSDGYAYRTGSGTLFNTGAGSGKMPAKQTNTRLYEIWGRYESTTLNDFVGANLEINRSTTNDKWTAYMQWYSGKWDPYISQHISGVWNFRAAPTDITITAPLSWLMQLYDHGDTLLQVITAIDDDTTNVAQFVNVKYNASSRTDKTVEACHIYYNADGTNPSYNKIRGFRISDI